MDYPCGVHAKPDLETHQTTSVQTLRSAVSAVRCDKTFRSPPYSLSTFWRERADAGLNDSLPFMSSKRHRIY